MERKQFNKKEFLDYDSNYSCSLYHATIDDELFAVFRIHDCNNGIKIWNNLNNSEEVKEMINKLRVLGKVALDFANHIENNF
ncbi:MAG: hypothetical protein LBE91_08150 [Tannerella sp.]|jgi:hypothetical protein|nr:hypothetical protein [Tannerella sp.]